ncbi:sensor domain-containing diguanylate cyclase/phosphohydrolase [Halarsenatibacter silvermanii]|uniref:PAS domain S-box-containing protein/diguanylate cyclase (GGDEF) domain-containing protein n=1 Tax=Halarsenatibacter silvermanii TaxID=321763 RepID=A0A1G9IXI7_9FIRM|nr:diguanylate cyclase [Halarsenatibacter silvermanii]SDL29554.1 PAS domain S-box-containing protein/diguanylate cyclase (GGDEF) domain-containing protein [Halarsenatibacter silvermanii]
MTDNIFASLPMGAALLKKNLIIDQTNREWSKLFAEMDRPATELENGSNYPEILRGAGFIQEDIDELVKEFNLLIENEIEKFNMDLECVNGEEKSRYALRAGIVQDKILVVKEEITVSECNNNKLEGLLKEYKIVFDSVHSSIFLLGVDDNKRITFQKLNPLHEKLTGLSTENIKDKTPVEVFGPELGKEIEKNYRKCLNKRGKIEYEEKLTLPEGERVWSTSLTPIIFDGKIEKIIGTSRDITRIKKREKELRYVSYHDKLTDLYNRFYLEAEMDRLDTERQLPISMIMCDINGMKIVNDTYGHKTGDELLVKVAEILQANTREEDIVARWAGDEFVILLPQTGTKMARKIVDRIEETCQKTEIAGFKISLGLGIATKVNKEVNLQEVLSQADERMYKDKLTKGKSPEYKAVQNMLATLRVKKTGAERHYLRINELALKLGRVLNLPEKDLHNLSLVAILHDLGKATIPEDILNKTEELSGEEWRLVKKHLERGGILAAETEEFSFIAEEILHRHERWDGQGYPDGLEKENIPLLSRIIAVVDAYDVILCGSNYRDPAGKEAALKEIEENAGSQFDPELAKKFVQMMRAE